MFFLNVVLRVLPVTIYLKTMQTGCYTLCYALTFLLHDFVWPLHLPNLVVTTNEVKILNVNRTEQKTLIVRPIKSQKQEEYIHIGKNSHYFSL